MSADTDTADQPWRDADTLERLYIDDGLERPEVADRLGCSPSTVDDWLSRHGICKQKTADRPWHDGDELRRLYDDEEMTIRDIAAHFDIATSTVRKWLSANDILVADARRKYSDSDLSRHLRALHNGCEFRVTLADLRDADGPCASVYRRRFGSWHAALEAAGIDPDAPTRAPSSHRERIGRVQAQYLMNGPELARQLLRATAPFERCELDISHSEFQTCRAREIIVKEYDADRGASESCRWELADGVADWIRTHVATTSRCPSDDCECSGIRNLGDGEFTCSNDDCDARFGRETAEVMLR
jgi:transposase-like protein